MNKITPIASRRGRRANASSTRPARAVSAEIRPLRPQYSWDTAGQVMRAIADGRCHVAYQPVFRADNLELVGAEALFRMCGFDGLPVPPGAFMPKLELSNAIRAVTSFVTETACGDLALWREVEPALQVSINVSAMDLSHERFVPELLAHQMAWGLPVDALELEVVERAPVQPGPVGDTNLRELSRLGVPVAIEDFGRAYADATRLTDMPASKLKLDRSLLRTAAGPSGWQSLGTVIEHAHERGIEVVAEGVETTEELGQVVEMG